jgi:hypothetical protein
MKDFLNYIIKLIFPLFLIFSIFFGLYYNADPYFDLKKHENFSWKYHFNQTGDLATKKLISNKKKYNSFIFGSSRAASVYACYLEKIIPESKFFHYCNFNESIGGVRGKLFLLDSLNYKIDNVLIYLDTDLIFKHFGEVNSADHYLIVGKSKFRSIYDNFRLFMRLDVDKIKILLGKSPSIFPNYTSDLETNDLNHICSEQTIIDYPKSPINEVNYRKKIDSLKISGKMYFRDLSNLPHKKENQISLIEEKYLNDIKLIFEKHNTNYKIVIPPLYDLKQFSNTDSIILNSIFSDRIYDFSGLNEFTQNEYNFDDVYHFLPYVSHSIINKIYND